MWIHILSFVRLVIVLIVRLVHSRYLEMRMDVVQHSLPLLPFQQVLRVLTGDEREVSNSITSSEEGVGLFNYNSQPKFHKVIECQY